MNNWILVRNGGFPQKPEGSTEMRCGNVRAYYQRDGRFARDQLFCVDGGRLVIVDGVILNLSELKARYDCGSLREIVNQAGDSCYSGFIGPFCGAFYHADRDALTAYGNQTGDAPVFYYHAEHLFAVSNDLNLIVSLLRENGIPYTLDQRAAGCIMSFGYMLDDSTWIQEIKRLEPGEYLRLADGALTLGTYFHLSFTPVPVSEEDALESIHDGFCRAVKRCFDKDIEYGCPLHLADMSGGLDSRLVNFAAAEMGYQNIVNISYSQSGSDEQRIAELVSKRLGHVLLHEQLDEASFLYDIDRMVEWEYGLAPYFGLTGGLNLLRVLNMASFGLEHTGQMGDVVIGAFLRKNTAIDALGQRYSDLLDVEIPAEIRRKYDGKSEEFLIRTRGFHGALSTHLMRRHCTYAVSPFLDTEFLAACMRIPAEMRAGHRLYWKLFDTYYPEAAAIPSTRGRNYRGLPRVMRAVSCRWRNAVNRAAYAVGLRRSGESPNSMNPIQYWYDTNAALRAFIRSYHDDNIKYLQAYPEVLRGAELLYSSKKALDKLLALSAIASVRLYFGRGEAHAGRGEASAGRGEASVCNPCAIV